MVKLIDSIQNPVWRAFVWRVFNTFVAVILPVFAGSIIAYFTSNNLPLEASSFANVDLWNSVIGSVIISLLGSVGAGINKATRVIVVGEEG